MPKKLVTIRDVARHAGVSVATASRVVSGKDVVSSETRERVLAVVEELGFTPSPAARRLSLGRTMTIGVVVSFLTRPQAAERLRGIEAVLADSDYDLVIYNVETTQRRDHYLSTLVGAHRTDGLLVVSLPPAPASVPALEAAPVPVVFIDVHVPYVSSMPRVIGDDIAGGAAAARHLLELGHRRIGFIGDAPESPFGFTSSLDREAGMRRELDAAGVALPPEWVGHGAHGRYEARELALRMLSREPRPSAIFAASDTQALGVIAAAHEAGLNVPEDLSVVGYDDIEAADYVGLTTIRQQLFESGRRGAELLLAAIEKAPESKTVVRLSPELVVRTTTAPPKEGRR
ncbi:MAG TPA: LacI family DNA-binding transcriptional regulator [Candidatus Limnocylindrales bacterium]|nr:LacI family DNA-binding transcriptional regulator [Candidatus Limnocylindrales bacterium]